MRHALRTCAALLALVAGTARADVKLGVVDLQRALNEVDEGKAAKAVLKKDFDEKQKQIDAKKVDFEKAKADFDKQSVVMAEQAKREKATELDRKALELQQLFMALQKDLSEREREVTRGIFEKMAAVVREIAEAEGFTMVLERTDAGIVYAPVSLDVTNELIRKYNARHPGGGANGAKKPDAPKADAKAPPPAKQAATPPKK
jgi:outer membrane protein